MIWSILIRPGNATNTRRNSSKITLVATAVVLYMIGSLAKADPTCPEDPGVAVSRGTSAFLQDMDEHLCYLDKKQTSDDGVPCKLMSWSRDQAVKYPGCDKFFVGENGRIGKLGHLVAKEVQDDIDQTPAGQTSVYLKDYDDLEKSNMCPGFKIMTDAEKKFFWTWFFEILAFSESSCKPDVPDNYKAVSPPAVGLYQMEGRLANRETRGPACDISNAAIRTPEGNTSCAMSIFKKLLRKNNGVFGGGKRAEYWQGLKPGNLDNAKIRKFLPRYPLCDSDRSGESALDEYTPHKKRGHVYRRKGAHRHHHKTVPKPTPPQTSSEGSAQ